MKHIYSFFEDEQELIYSLLLLHNNGNDIELDPFLGTGTTAVCCVEQDRHYIGFEIEPTYYEIAKKRIADTLDNKDKFEQIEF